MKKQTLTSVNLQLKKVSIANLAHIKGSGDDPTNEPTKISTCCSTPEDTCHPTLTTRPDSFPIHSETPTCDKNTESRNC